MAIDQFGLSSAQVAQAFLLGLVAALGAAWLPASEAARCDPARILHPGAALEIFSPLRPWGLRGAVLFLAVAAAASFLSLHGGSKFLGFAAAGAVIAGFSLLVPWFAVFVARCFRPCGTLARLASDHLIRSLHRNAMTIAALGAAVAMTISVTVMIHSFRASVLRWVDHTLVADIYFAPAINDIAGPQAFLPVETLDWAKSRLTWRLPPFREMPIRFRDHPSALAVVDGRARGDLEFLPGLPRQRREEISGRSSRGRFGKFRHSVSDRQTKNHSAHPGRPADIFS